jgi:hypothetical protein
VPLATDRDHLPLALDENGPDFLLTSGDVEEFLCCLRLIMAEFAY